ncbi:hypothetical protein Gasu_62080 isoform 1 [Galdieria sulphuraria]|uniref:Uncharacterized protein n=1 Tax=Galdieria sulphuraria TaxID=130081 RepID=M2XR52_GALSU|nr:hypothetical protein Gasu_62080 isoform 1 [Galdieria sulphuraria]EME26143.1 hypothetical protein isoform 1 [Galdieria sulphuraria]|eukprot:XP_005702663.1 hypothetical protein isoform 1 [Galdieria sulphuraria]
MKGLFVRLFSILFVLFLSTASLSRACVSKKGVEVSFAFTGSSTVEWSFYNPTNATQSVALVRGATGSGGTVSPYVFGDAYYPAYSVDGLAEFYAEPTASNTQDKETPLVLMEYESNQYGVGFVFILSPGRNFTILEGGYTNLTPTCAAVVDIEYRDTAVVNIDYGFLSQCLEFSFICQPDPFNVTTAVYEPVYEDLLNSGYFWPSDGDSYTIYSSTTPVPTPSPTPSPSPTPNPQKGSVFAPSTVGTYDYQNGATTKNVTIVSCPSGSFVSNVETLLSDSNVEGYRLHCSDGSVSGVIGHSGLYSNISSCLHGVRGMGGKAHTVYPSSVAAYYPEIWTSQVYCGDGNYSSLTSHTQQFDTMDYSICPFGTRMVGVKAESYESTGALATIRLECGSRMPPGSSGGSSDSECKSSSSSRKGMWAPTKVGTYYFQGYGMTYSQELHQEFFCNSTEFVTGLNAYIHDGSFYVRLSSLQVLCSKGTKSPLFGSQNTSNAQLQMLDCGLSHGLYGIGGKSNEYFYDVSEEYPLWDVRALCQAGNVSSLSSHTSQYDGGESYSLCSDSEVMQGIRVSIYGDLNFIGQIQAFCVPLNTSLVIA